MPAEERDPLCLLLLPRPLERFILRDQAADLLTAPGVVAADPPRIRYGALGRLPALIADRIAQSQARRLLKALPGTPAAVAIFHPFQYPLARAVIAIGGGDAELWYGRWDRYEAAYDADAKLRGRIAELHELAAARSALTFVVNDELLRQERDAGRDATLVPLSADDFPAPEVSGERPPVVAISLGHLGWRTDWSLLLDVSRRMEELVLLLVGEWHDDECSGDPAYAACRNAPNLVWLGAQDDDAAARLIICADVGIVPFKVEPFNDAGLPYRILKYALLGRRTVSPDLAGVRTWSEVVQTAQDAEEFVAALRAQAGTRTRPHEDVREWALAQTARTQNEPLWARLRALGVDTGE